jgi:hypothetical protein
MNGNLAGARGQVTISHGASIAANTRQDTTVAFNGAQLGDRAFVNPAAAPAAGIIVVEPIVCTVAGQITVSVANITTATVAAGTAVVYNITLIKNTGQSST